MGEGGGQLGLWEGDHLVMFVSVYVFVYLQVIVCLQVLAFPHFATLCWISENNGQNDTHDHINTLAAPLCHI